MNETETILVVDDELELREMLSDYLNTKGYRVCLAENGTVMREQLQQHTVDLVLMDLNLPGEDGLSLMRYLRNQTKQIGIIMVTGAGDVIDRVLGLEMGADDYIVKPFELREVYARIKSVLRRYRLGQQDDSAQVKVDAEQLKIGTFILDLKRRQLLHPDGQPFAITQMEFDLLNVFATRPNRVLTRDQILDLTQNREWDPYDRSIDIRIARLRRKLEADPSNPQIIKTIRGVGYIYTPE